MKQILFLLLVMCSAFSSAQEAERKISVWGHVRDSFTKQGIRDVKITVMTTDSTVLDTTRVWGNPQPGVSYDATYKTRVPAVAQRLIIKAEHPDYEDTYVHFNIRYIKRNTFFDAPWHYMKRKPKEQRLSDMDRELGEVVVKATKVRIAYRGDTLVYNADAFNVPEGSMLDGLLRQMDGVELNDDGEIKVNGRKVDYLTLNGKDFFKGQNKVMLENLPYYTVKEVKVFNKTTERSEFLGRDVEEKEYVMDVQLKREYSIGYMGNLEAGGGIATPEGLDGERTTEADRYMARFFAARFSDNTRMALMGNTNNINQQGRPTQSGDWRDNTGQNGRTTTHRLNGNLMMNGKDNKVTNNVDYSVEWDRGDFVSRTSTENYLSSGNSYSHNESSSRSRDFTFNFGDNFRVKLPQLKVPFNMDTRLDLTYNRHHDWNQSASAMFATDPFAKGISEADTVNTTQTRSHYRSRNFNVQMLNALTLKLPWGDHIDLYLNGHYWRNPGEGDAQERYRYHHEPDRSNDRNRHDDTPSHSYCWNARLNYTIAWLSGWSVETYGRYEQEYQNNVNDYYTLSIPSPHIPSLTPPVRGRTPSDLESPSPLQGEGWGEGMKGMEGMEGMESILDLANSFSYGQMSRDYRAGIVSGYTKNADGNYTNFRLELPVRHILQRMDYRSDPLSTSLSRHYTTFDPSVSLSVARNNFSRYFYLNANITHTPPSLLQMLDRTNTNNPLAVMLGNPDLQQQTAYTFAAYFQRSGDAKTANHYVSVSGSLTDNRVVQGYSYNQQTGVRTYRPANVDGNWYAGFLYNLGMPLDSANLFRFSLDASYRLDHIVDLASTDGDGNSARSTVWVHGTTFSPSLRYQKDKLSVRLSGNLTWENTHRRQQEGITSSMAAINTFRFNYGLSATTPLLWKVSLSTDFTVYSRRGYTDPSMNTDEPVWNATLSRPFLRGKLLLLLRGYDLLAQRTNFSYTANAQGRVETWRNGLGRYVLLSLQWKFSHNPKRRT